MSKIENFIKSIFSNNYGGVPTNTIPSIMPITVIQSIRSGILTHINTNTIFVSKGEMCHYIERAILVTEKNQITKYTGGSTGLNIRISRGVNYRIGKRKGRPIRENVSEFTKGTIYITNKRVIFAAKKNGFERSVDSISVITPYKDAITLQFGNTSYSLLLPDVNIALSVISLIKS